MQYLLYHEVHQNRNMRVTIKKSKLANNFFPAKYSNHYYLKCVLENVK